MKRLTIAQQRKLQRKAREQRAYEAAVRAARRNTSTTSMAQAFSRAR